MKSTGIVRRLDDLGRIVIPKETRKVLGINEGDSLEIFIDGQTIMLKKYEASCVFCGEAARVIDFSGKKVCKDCIQKLSK